MRIHFSQNSVARHGVFAAGLLCVLLVWSPTQSQAQSEGVLYTFTGGSDGGLPVGPVVRDGKGNLYGTTIGIPAGTVFEVTSAGTETVLHNFGTGSGGFSPYGGVIRDSNGNLYGVAEQGGTNNGGTVYEITSAGKASTIYNFGSPDDGVYPHSRLVRDNSGNLYGTTLYGGSKGQGTVFEVSSSGKELLLYSFAGGTGDGASPFAGVVRDSKGNLFGTTQLGGANGVGTVFEVTSAGKESVLYSFAGGTDGQYPCGDLVRDPSGNLYGTTEVGGANGSGTIFELSSANKESVLYSFTGGNDGANPFGGLIRDSSGNFYGTTSNGGAASFGTVFELSSTLTETTFYSFTGGNDGGEPAGALVRDSSGNLYGTTEGFGSTGFGVVFKVTP